MQTKTSFDLNRAVLDWRGNLAQSPAFRGDNLDELESHLRDSVAGFQARGLSVEEAFLIASRRMGKGAELAAEFGKVNGREVWIDRALWMLIGIQAWGLVSSVIGSLARGTLVWGWGNIRHDYTQSGWVLPVTCFSVIQLAAMVASLALCWWLVVRKGSAIGHWLGARLQRRSTLIMTGAGLWLLWLVSYALSSSPSVILPRYLGPEAYGAAALYSAYSHVISLPLQTATLVVMTLTLARKRLRTVQG